MVTVIISKLSITFYQDEYTKMGTDVSQSLVNLIKAIHKRKYRSVDSGGEVFFIRHVTEINQSA